MKKMKKLLGRLKQWQVRLASYVSIIQFAMVFYLFIVENKWFDWYIWTILISMAVISIISFDAKLVMPNQLGYAFEVNTEWKKHKRNQKKIMDHLGLDYEE